jgi:WD40 repeat protein/serine/threonine protein kinase
VDDSPDSDVLPGALSSAESLRVSKLLDESIEMAPHERDAWLQEIERTDPTSAAMLRDLFASQAELIAKRFLETRDSIGSYLTSRAAAVPGLIGKQFGPYRVTSLLGHGGMGSVWLAARVDGLFTRQVALKLVHPALMGRGMTERFTRERQILASLNHPHIARLIDAGLTEDAQPYLTLEYVAGMPITAYCDDRRLSIRERLQLYRQVLNAVQYAHANLVIHRDLKPSNILVTDDGRVHLLDFGIAKLLTEGEARESELTQLGGRALTPDYAAPEQIVGAPVTTAADVYALGVMLYELLTGERPYKPARDSRGALEEAILQADPVAPSRAASSEAAARARATSTRNLSKTLKGDLDTITLKALEKSPGARYATANAFDEDIAHFLNGEAVLAQRDSVSYRALKFVRRHRLAIFAASVLLLTLTGGLVATTYEARVASAQRDAANQAQLRSLTQTAAARVKSAQIPDALGIILEVLHRTAAGSYTPEALSVFQEARAADAQVLTLAGHSDWVRSVAFSPDGRRLATTSRDHTARVYDVITGRQILLLSGHTHIVRSAAFSPDGRRIATASADRTARVWDAATGRQILRLTGHADGVRTAVFSPDGSRILTAAFDKTVRVWDAATGRQIRIISGHAQPVTTAAYSPDGRRIVTASFDQTARIWDAATGRQIRILGGHDGMLASAAFSPDGRFVVTASDDKTARIWDVATGRQVQQLSGHTLPLAGAAFSPDGRFVVTASEDKTARIWDAATGRQVQQLSGHTLPLAGAAFSPDGRFVATASDDKTARIWDTHASGRIAFFSEISNPQTAGFSPDGRRVLTTSPDMTARIWDALTGREIMLFRGHAAPLLSAAFSPDGQRIVTASYDRSARIWDVATGREVTLLSGDWSWLNSAAFSPDGQHIVTASDDTTARIWDAATGREILRISEHTLPLNTAAFSPDGRRIVTSSADKTARIWDTATGRQIVLLSGHTDGVTSAAFSPDGQRIVTASNDQTARVWDVASGQEIMPLSGHTDNVNFAAFSADGSRIVTASTDKTARVWDASTGQQLTVLVHSDLVRAAEFSPDGNRIVTASDEARVWDAHIPAIDVQIGWAAAAQFDVLSKAQRYQLGMADASGVHPWPGGRSKCDESAAAPYDPERRAAGLMLDQIVADIALAACEHKGSGADAARSTYQQGRALVANGKSSLAARDFEEALTHGYPAAAVDLGMLLAQPSSELLDVPRAIPLFERAWKEGVAMAAFELGRLYERGVNRSDQTRAWFWYQKAADAGEPNALARFGERDEDAALTEQIAARKNSLWLASFTYYAAAAERARIEDWPDEAWRNWRYRRASLAHLLAREGAMREAAEAFENVRKKYAHSPTVRERLGLLVESLAARESH